MGLENLDSARSAVNDCVRFWLIGLLDRSFSGGEKGMPGSYAAPHYTPTVGAGCMKVRSE